MEFTPGAVIAGKYEIDREIGEGATSVVFAARASNERLALKILLPEISADSKLSGRFVREARAARAITTEYAARVHEVGSLPDGRPYLAMEYVEGRSLARKLREEGPRPVEEAIETVLQCCIAVADLFGRDVVHGELLPSNIILPPAAGADDGLGEARHLKIIELGMSRQRPPAEDATVVVETSRWRPMVSESAPAPDAQADARVDVSAVGALLHELLTGRPATGPSAVEASFAAHARATRAPPIPGKLVVIVASALGAAASKSFADVGELARALAPFAPRHGARLAAEVDKVLATKRRLPRDLAGSLSLSPDSGTPSSSFRVRPSASTAVSGGNRAPSVPAPVQLVAPRRPLHVRRQESDRPTGVTRFADLVSRGYRGLRWPMYVAAVGGLIGGIAGIAAVIITLRRPPLGPAPMMPAATAEPVKVAPPVAVRSLPAPSSSIPPLLVSPEPSSSSSEWAKKSQPKMLPLDLHPASAAPSAPIHPSSTAKSSSPSNSTMPVPPKAKSNEDI